MKKDWLIVVDFQNDFVSGSLGTKEAISIVPDVINKVSTFNGEICFTKDTHDIDYLESYEGKNLPVKHCIKGEDGHNLIPELEEIVEENDYKVFEKNTFGSVDLALFLKDLYLKDEVNSITLIGLCTDICVISNALLLKAYMPDVDIIVDSKLTRGVTMEKYYSALDVLKSNQIKVV